MREGGTPPLAREGVPLPQTPSPSPARFVRSAIPAERSIILFPHDRPPSCPHLTENSRHLAQRQAPMKRSTVPRAMTPLPDNDGDLPCLPKKSFREDGGSLRGEGRPFFKRGPFPLKPSPCHKKRAVPRRERPVRHLKGWQHASSRRRRPPRRRGDTEHAARASSRRPCGSLPTGPPARSKGCCCQRSYGPSGRCG